jgi:hypothetical protein
MIPANVRARVDQRFYIDTTISVTNSQVIV